MFQKFLKDAPLHLHQLQVHQEQLYPPRQQEERTGGVLTWFLMSDLDETFTETSDGGSFHLTPSPGPSGMSMSSKTPGKDLEDRWSLDMVPDFRS